MIKGTSESYMLPGGEGNVTYWNLDKSMYTSTWVENSSEETIELGDVVQLEYDSGQLVITKKLEEE